MDNFKSIDISQNKILLLYFESYLVVAHVLELAAVVAGVGGDGVEGGVRAVLGVRAVVAAGVLSAAALVVEGVEAGLLLRKGRHLVGALLVLQRKAKYGFQHCGILKRQVRQVPVCLLIFLPRLAVPRSAAAQPRPRVRVSAPWAAYPAPSSASPASSAPPREPCVSCKNELLH